MKPYVLALLALVPCAVFAQQETKKVPVKFTCNCKDGVGRLYATALRDLLSQSPRYALVESIASRGGPGWPEGPEMGLNVTSISILEGTPDSSAFSEVITVGDELYLTHSVRVCGINKVAFCATDMFSELDEAVQTLKTKARNSTQ